MCTRFSASIKTDWATLQLLCVLTRCFFSSGKIYIQFYFSCRPMETTTWWRYDYIYPYGYVFCIDSRWLEPRMAHLQPASVAKRKKKETGSLHASAKGSTSVHPRLDREKKKRNKVRGCCWWDKRANELRRRHPVTKRLWRQLNDDRYLSPELCVDNMKTGYEVLTTKAVQAQTHLI